MKICIQRPRLNYIKSKNVSPHLELDIGEKLKSRGLSYNMTINYLDRGSRSTASVIGVDNEDKLWVVSPVDKKTPLCLTDLDLDISLKHQGVWINNESPLLSINVAYDDGAIVLLDISWERLQKFELYAGADVIFQKTGKRAKIMGIDRHDQLWFHFENGSGALGKFTSKTALEKAGILQIFDRSNIPAELKVNLNGGNKVINIHADILNQCNLICGQQVLTPFGKGIVFGACDEGYLWFIVGENRMECSKTVKDIPTMHEAGIISLYEYEIYMKTVTCNPKRLDHLALKYITRKTNESDIIKKGVPAFRNSKTNFFSNLNRILETNKINMESSELLKMLKKEEASEKEKEEEENLANYLQYRTSLENELQRLTEKVESLTKENQELKKLANTASPSESTESSEHILKKT